VRAQALAAGQIDATTLSIGTWASLPDRTGLHVLVDQDAYFAAAPLVNKVNAVTARVLEERSADVDAVIRALVRISRDFAADPDLWVSSMAAALPDTDAALLADLAPSFAQSWTVNGGMSAAALDYSARWLYATDDFAGLPSLTLRDWVDFAPLDRALADLGRVAGHDPSDR